MAGRCWVRGWAALLTSGSLVFASAWPAGSAELRPAPAPQEATLSVAIERPARDLTVAGSVLIDGWAADTAAGGGTGVDGVDLYLDNAPDGGGTLLGAAEYGRQRDDIATRLGDPRFGPAGFRYRWALDTVPAGPHTVYAVARGSAGTVASTSVPITVSERSCLPQVVADNLLANATVSAPMTVTGYAADPGSREGTGVTGLRLFLDAPPDGGGTLLATATYGVARPDAATAFGEERFAAAGFTLDWDPTTLPEGPHNLYFVATGTCGEVSSPIPLVVAKPGAAPAAAAAPASTDVESGGCITVNVTTPLPGMTVNPPVVVSGSAYNTASTTDTGVSKISVFNGKKDAGGTALGDARYGIFTKPVSDTVGVRFASSGYNATLNTPLTSGPLTLYVYATGGCGEGYKSIPVTVDTSLPPGAAVAPAGSVTPATGGATTGTTPSGATVAPTAAAGGNAATAAAYSPGAAPSSANAPQPPTNLQSTTAGSSATLTWGASPGGNVRDYTIWQSTDGNTFTQVQTKASNETTHTFNNLNPGTVYYFFVIARGPGGDTSARSNVAGPVVLGGGKVEPPANVQVQQAAGNTINLTWSKSPTAGVTSYYIFLGRNQTTPVQYSEAGADATSAQIPLQNPGNTYTIYVTAVAGTQQSGPSNIIGPCTVGQACTVSSPAGSPGAAAVTGTPGTAPPSSAPSTLFGGLPGSTTPAGSAAATSTPVALTNPTGTAGTTGTPTAPANLTATLQGSNTVLLTWTASSTGQPTNYQIFQSASGGQFTSVGYVAGSSTQAQIPNLATGTSYSFYVVAVNGSASSPASNTAGPVAVTGGAVAAGVGPTNVQVSFPAGQSMATVSWTPISGYNVAFYRISWVGPTSSQTQVPGTQYTATIQNLTPNQTYTITVQAIDNAGNPVGQAATAYASPGAVGGVGTPAATVLTAQPQSNRRVFLSWTPVAGAAQYQIYRNNQFLITVQSTQTSYQDQITSGAVATGQYYIITISSTGQSSPNSNVVTVNLLP